MHNLKNTKTLVILALLSAMAIVVMLFLRLPIMPAAPFLNYDMKDIIIVMGGFLYGPLAAVAISLVVSFVEMITVSNDGIVGMVMNVVSSCSFAGTAALVYKRRRNIDGAIIGLIAGALTATGMMLLWNYIITPVYLGIPRTVVAGMLVPVFLPFNLFKTGLNGALTLFLYKPVVMALLRAGLYKSAADESETQLNKGLMLAAFLLVIGIVHILLLMQIISLLQGIAGT
jgi:riboflavin transporter FmnP